MTPEQEEAFEAFKAEIAEFAKSGATEYSPLEDGDYTNIAQIPPEISELSHLKSLDLTSSPVTDLRPLLALDLLWENAGQDTPLLLFWSRGIWFQDTPATASDPTLRELSEIEDHQERAQKDAIVFENAAAVARTFTVEYHFGGPINRSTSAPKGI